MWLKKMKKSLYDFLFMVVIIALVWFLHGLDVVLIHYNISDSNFDNNLIGALIMIFILAFIFNSMNIE